MENPFLATTDAHESSPPKLNIWGAEPLPDELYTYGGEKLGYVARYPSYSPLRDNEDYYAQQQSGWNKFTNGLGQLWALGKNSFANHFATYGREFNALTSANWDKMWNDTFGKETAQLINTTQNLYPIYETNQQQKLRDEKGGFLTAFKQFVPLTGRAGNAWANLFGQLGFTAGMFGGVIAETGLLAAGTYLTGGATAEAAAIKTAANIEEVSRIKSMWNFFKETRGLTRIPEALRTENVVARFAESKPLEWHRLFVAGAGEASIEANTTYQQSVAQQKQEYFDKYGIQAPADVLGEIEKNAVKAGNADFNFNLPVLMATDLLVIGNWFKPGALSKMPGIEKISEGVVKESPILSSKSIIQKALKNYPNAQKVLKYAQRGGGFIQSSLGEGTQELLQQAGQNAAQNTFDLFNSDQNKGFGSFLMSSLDETWKLLGTREGTDQFVGGFITGFGMDGFNAIANRISGKKGVEKQLIQQGIEKIIQANSRYVNALNQLSALENSQKAINKNDIKTAKDIQRDSEISLFNTLSQYGVTEEYINELGHTLEQLKQKDPNGVKDMLQDRDVSDVVNSVKERFYAYDDLYKKASKQIGNPYKEGTTEHRTWDAAIRTASSFEVYSKDAFDRAKTLQNEIADKYPIDESVISAALDPTTLPSEINDLQDYINKRTDTLKIEGLSKEEISKRKTEINKEKDKLKILQKIKDTYYDEKGNLKEEGKKQKNTAETVSAILKGFYGNESSAPAELKQSLTDMMELENDAFEYRNLYNILSNPDQFQHFGKAYVQSYLDKIGQIQQKVNDAIENPKANPTNVRYDAKTFDEAITGKETQGEARNFITGVQKKIDNNDIKRNPDGTFNYKDKSYTAQELFDNLIKETKPKIEGISNNEGETIKEAVNKHFNELINQVQTKPAETLEENKPTPAPTKSNIINDQPKTKNKSSEERFAFTAKGSNTLVHYFDKLIGKIWKGANSFKNITENLIRVGDIQTAEKIIKVFEEFGNNARITTLYLATNELVYGDKKEKEINQTNDIRVIYDGIRHYIITKKGAKSAKQIIEDELGLQIEDVNQNVVVKKKGQDITSPFRATQGFTEENDAAIHKVKRGDKLILEITQNDYNNELLQEKDEKKITDRLHISVKHNGITVGILRAADFLFELKDNTLVEDFRNQLQEKLKTGGLVQGLTLGEVTMVAPVASRNKNFQQGVISWTNIADFNPEGFSKTFYFVDDNGNMIDDSGKTIEDTDTVHDRRSFRKGGVYMKIEKKNGINHTVQIYRSDKQDSEAPYFTKQEFIKEKKYLEVGQTDLNQQNPILSKRLIINLKVNEDISDTENKNEELQQQFDDLGIQDITITDNNGNTKPLTNTTREDNIIKSDQGEFSLNDIQSIEETPNLTEQLEQSNEWEQTKNLSQEEIEKWIIENGEQDQIYKLSDGTNIRVVKKEGNNTFLSVEKNGNVYYTGFDTEGKRLKADKLEDLKPKNEAVNEAVSDAAIIQKLSATLNSFGINGASLFKKMQEEYNKSVVEGQPITSLFDLLDKSGLTSDEQDIFDYVVTPIFYSDFWTYISQSESIFDQIADKKWNDFRSQINMPLSALETLDNTNTPENKYKEHAKKIEQQIKDVFAKTGISIPDFPDLLLTTIEDIQKLADVIRSALKFDNIREGFSSLQKNLSLLGLRTEANALLTINKVDKKSLGRSPIQTFDIGSIYTDLALSSVGGKVYVRNVDGYFVEVAPKKKSDKNVLVLQNNLLSLLKIQFPINYLQAYSEIYNGDFSALKQRALLENQRRLKIQSENTPVLTKNDVTSEERMKSYYKIITSPINAQSVYLDDNFYYNIMTTNDGQSVYLRENKSLSAQQIRNVMSDLKISRNVPKRLSNLGNRIEKVRGLQQKIEDLKNCK